MSLVRRVVRDHNGAAHPSASPEPDFMARRRLAHIENVNRRNARAFEAAQGGALIERFSEMIEKGRP